MDEPVAAISASNSDTNNVVSRKPGRESRPVVLILFPDEWLAYSPTVINLLNLLVGQFDVHVSAIDTGKYERLRDRRVSYQRVNLTLARVLDAVGLYKPLKAFLLRRAITKHRPDIIIAVDSVGAWAAQKLGRKFHYLSLEVNRDRYFRRLHRENILSIVTQSRERYQYLFGTDSIPTYLIQNAPTFEGPLQQQRDERALVFLGNAIPKHAIFQCVEFVADCGDWTLTVKGNIPEFVKQQLTKRFPDVLAAGRLVLDDDYLPEEEVLPFLARFYAGFCLYDYSQIDADDFNYVSAPSGKLFNYYAAGVPVVASDMLGLASVDRFETGVSIKNLNAESIAGALSVIAHRYNEFQQNCYRAAESFSFEANAQSFLRMLVSTQSEVTESHRR